MRGLVVDKAANEPGAQENVVASQPWTCEAGAFLPIARSQTGEYRSGQSGGRG